MNEEYIPGEYEIVSNVLIRREPRIIAGNVVGALNVGTQRQIYSTFTDTRNYTWGRISEADAAGIAEWICLRGTNRTFAQRLPDPSNGKSFERRFSELEDWARTQGYKG